MLRAAGVVLYAVVGWQGAGLPFRLVVLLDFRHFRMPMEGC